MNYLSLHLHKNEEVQEQVTFISGGTQERWGFSFVV